MNSKVGIKGVGVWLPETIRMNDHWSPELVAEWRASLQKRAAERRARAPRDDLGAQRALTALAPYDDDPFLGVRQRRVAPNDMPPVDMEVLAARAALRDAGLQPGDVGALLTYTLVPDVLNTNNACELHHALDLPVECVTAPVDGICNAFFLQLALAEGLIATGRARHAMLVQSSQGSRVIDESRPTSTWYGEGATAVIVGAVDDAHGLRGQSHRTDGSVHRAVFTSVVGGRWFDDGVPEFHTNDWELGERMWLSGPESQRQVVDDAISEAGWSRDEVDFFACHQIGMWFRPATQEHCHLQGARTFDTAAFAGNMGPCNVPLVLHAAAAEGSLHEGDRVVMTGGGAGMTYSAAAMVWGR